MDDFSHVLSRSADEVEAGLDSWFRTLAEEGEGAAPPRLVAAMRHGALGGGKRLRPFLLIETGRLFGLPPEASLRAALAIEMVHCYSLIHDDLPAMDDDDLRRGRPTVHRAFDEATAILAGDALLTHAFGLLAAPSCHPDAAVRVRLVAELAAGAGALGMVGGQMRDLEGEGKMEISEGDILTISAMKTGALMRAAVRMGAILGGADAGHLDLLTRFAAEAGVAFQLADDILDVTATADELGKETGKDGERGKQTIVARVGIAEARRRLDRCIDAALAALAPWGEEADTLRATARFFAARDR